jgi:hypothetical protein
MWGYRTKPIERSIVAMSANLERDIHASLGEMLIFDSIFVRYPTVHRRILMCADERTTCRFYAQMHLAVPLLGTGHSDPFCGDGVVAEHNVTAPSPIVLRFRPLAQAVTNAGCLASHPRLEACRAEVATAAAARRRPIAAEHRRGTQLSLRTVRTILDKDVLLDRGLRKIVEQIAISPPASKLRIGDQATRWPSRRAERIWQVSRRSVRLQRRSLPLSHRRECGQ